MVAAILSPSSYAVGAHSLLTLATALAILLLGLLVVVRERGSTVSRAFLTLAAVVGGWLFAFSLTSSATSGSVAIWWLGIAYLAIPAIGPALYTFTVVELGIYPRQHKVVWLGWLLAALFSAAAWWTDALIAGLHLYRWGYYPRYGWLGAPFIAFTCALLLASLHHQWVAYRASPPGADRRRVGALIGAFAVGYVALVDFAAAYGVPLYPFGYLAVLGFVGLAARAIWRYRLTEITPAFAARQIVETMSDGLFVLDRDGLVRVTNPAGCALLGLPREQLVGQRLSAVLDLESHHEWLEAPPGAGTVRTFELPYSPRPDERRVLSLSTSVIRDADGQPAATVCVARDITAARRAEDEIRRLNEDLERRVRERTAQLEDANRELEREVAERRRAEEARAQLLAREQQRAQQMRRLADASLLFDASLSPAEMLQIVAQQARQLIGAHWAVVNVVPDQDGHRPHGAVSLSEKYAAGQGATAQPNGADPTALLRATTFPIRMTQAELEAQPAWHELRRAAGWHSPPRGWLAVPLTGDDGRALGLIEVSDPCAGDLSDEDEAIVVQLARIASVELEKARLYREARDAVRARDSLLSIVSHDLRNPLASIIGSAELLQRVISRPGELNVARVQTNLARIESAATRMNALIGELLDSARLQAGQALELYRRPTDLVALARGVVAQYQARSDRRQLHFDAALAELAGLWDAARLERVLDNLLSNATKYTPDGGDVTVEVAREDADGPWAVLVVRDQGIGIPAADLPHVFDWFHRAGNVAGRIGGTGIGLASARQIVEQHGGTISVASEEGRGSTFTVRLPLLPAEQASEVGGQASVPQALVPALTPDA